MDNHNEEKMVIDTRFGSRGGLVPQSELDEHHRKMQGAHAPRTKKPEGDTLEAEKEDTEQ